VKSPEKLLYRLKFVAKTVQQENFYSKIIAEKNKESDANISSHPTRLRHQQQLGP